MKLKKLQFVQEINGILYYIDEYKNIYKTEDIISNEINPDVIARYDLNDGNYTIFELIKI